MAIQDGPLAPTSVATLTGPAEAVDTMTTTTSTGGSIAAAAAGGRGDEEEEEEEPRPELLAINQGQRVDYAMQEAFSEQLNEYISGE